MYIINQNILAEGGGKKKHFHIKFSNYEKIELQQILDRQIFVCRFIYNSIQFSHLHVFNNKVIKK